MIDQVIDVPLTKAQAEMLADDSFTRCFVAGMGSGKTFAAALDILQLAQANPGVPVIYAMPTIPMLLDVAIPEVLQLLDSLGFVDDVDYSLNKQRRVLNVEFEEGRGVIWFRSTENPRRLVGPSIAGIVVDEAEDNKEESVKILRSRVRHPRAKMKRESFYGTPESLSSWFHSVAEGDRQPGTKVVNASTLDNLFLDKEYVERAMRYWTKEEIEAYIYGRFVARRGRVYTQFNEAAHCRPYDDGQEGQYVMACDFGRGCMAWLFGQVIDERVHFFGEQVLEGSDTIEASKQARAWWCEYFRSIGLEMSPTGAAEMVNCYVDPAGEMKGSISDVRVLREMGFRVFHHHQHPRVKDRVLAVQEKLARTELFIDADRCPIFKRCIVGQAYDKNGIPEKGRPRDGKKAHDHCMDACGYLVVYLWPASRSRASIH